MTQVSAIVFDAPSTLSVKTLELKPFDTEDLEVEVSASGISTGTERLLWDGTLSREGLITRTFAPGRARVACEVAFGDPQGLKMMIDWQA